jgi:glutathione peroxidase
MSNAISFDGTSETIHHQSMNLHRFFPCLAFLLLAMTATAASSDLYTIPLKNIDGESATLAPYKGKVMLIVNVASKCGFTPQYKELEAIYRDHRDAGLVVLGFPCNQFGHQEPGTNAEIKEFCSLNFDVNFPLFDKIDVNGEHRHALYTFLAGANSPFPGDIQWNFTKFLVGRDGRILARFSSKVKPDAPELLAAVQNALAAK